MYKKQKSKASKCLQGMKGVSVFPNLVVEHSNPNFHNNSTQYRCGLRQKVGRTGSNKDNNQSFLEYNLSVERLFLRSLFIQNTKPAKTYGKRFVNDLNRWIQNLRVELFGPGKPVTRHWDWRSKQRYDAASDTDLILETLRKQSVEEVQEAINEDLEQLSQENTEALTGRTA